MAARIRLFCIAAATAAAAASSCRGCSTAGTYVQLWLYAGSTSSTALRLYRRLYCRRQLAVQLLDALNVVWAPLLRLQQALQHPLLL